MFAIVWIILFSILLYSNSIKYNQIFLSMEYDKKLRNKKIIKYFKSSLFFNYFFFSCKIL